jgi:glycosyltransferase 2 family protein
MRRLLPHVGLVVAVLGVAFVVRALIITWPEVRAAVAGANPAPLVAALALGSGAIFLIGLGWRRCLAALGTRASVRETLHWYYVGVLGKYVPGGILSVVGRGEMARRGGVPASVGYGSTVLSLAVTYLAAILVAAIALATGGAGRDGRYWPVLVLLPLGIAALHPRVVEAALRVARRVLRRELPITVPRWSVSLGLLLWHVPAWLAIGGATWLVAATLDASAPDVRAILFATVVSWVVGFLVVAAPGGIGVREAVFVATVTVLGSSGVVAAVAIVARVIFILVDLIGAAVATSVARSRTEAGTRSGPATRARPAPRPWLTTGRPGLTSGGDPGAVRDRTSNGTSAARVSPTNEDQDRR